MPETDTITLVTDGGDVTVDVLHLTKSGDEGPFRQKVGLWCAATSVLNNVLKFKAWVSSIPEPPDDESGHGTYADGVFTYTDKYHAGGGYNPNA
jgi:hypothetical protein